VHPPSEFFAKIASLLTTERSDKVSGRR